MWMAIWKGTIWDFSSILSFQHGWMDSPFYVELKAHWEVHIITTNYVPYYTYMTELHKHSMSTYRLKFKFYSYARKQKWMKIWFYTSLAVIGNWTFIPNGPFSYSRSQMIHLLPYYIDVFELEIKLIHVINIRDAVGWDIRNLYAKWCSI